MNIGLDSMIVVYAGLAPEKAGTRSPELKELSLRAKLFFHEHQTDVIFLPTVAVSEILVPVPKEQKGLLSAKLADLFICPPFDLQAASIAAELWASHKQLPPNQQYKKRQTLRADTMIVASLKAAGVESFYSHDASCRKLAELVDMAARDLPRKPDSNTPNALEWAAAFDRGETPPE